MDSKGDKEGVSVKRYSTILMYFALAALSLISFLITDSVSAIFLFVGIFHLLLYVNITVCTITNMVFTSSVGKDDSVWRMFCIMAGSASLAVGIALL